MLPRLEGELCSLLRLDIVHVRDAPGCYGSPREPAQASTADGVSIEVPACGRGGRSILLEARFRPSYRFDEWTLQQLTLAAHLAALATEIIKHRPIAASASLPSRASLPPNALVGSSRAMSDLRSQMERIANTDFTVLVQGESGTGKELVARQIHEQSGRRRGPFVAVNCAAIVDSLLEAELFGIEDRTATGVRGRGGKFEHADGGTMFLDEVSDLAPAAQAKLLRVIQELVVERVGGHNSRRVDTRIIVATNRSLKDLAARGVFREDLYYRLSGLELNVPPLRQRRDDVMELADYFLSRYRGSRRLAFSPSAAEAMRAYDWPGNVRELERLVEGAVALASSEWVGLEDLPPSIRGDYADVLVPALARNETMRAWGSRYARLVLDRCNGNKRQACRVLDISYHTLQGYLREDPRAEAPCEAPARPPTCDAQATPAPS
jgi:DNA-binding NtrC family response regulator